MINFLRIFFGIILNIFFRMAMLTQTTIGFIISQVGVAITAPIVSKKFNDMKEWCMGWWPHKEQDCCDVVPLPEDEACPTCHRIGFIHNDGSIW